MNKEIIALNSVQENEFLLLSYIEKMQLEKVLMLLDNGAKLTPFVLTNMSVRDYHDDSIKDVLLHTNVFDPNIFIWLKNYFAVDEMVEVFNHFGHKLPDDYPSDEDCVRLKMWDILSYRRKWNLVAENAPEVIEKQLEKQPYLINHLLKVDLEKYGPKALKEERYTSILEANTEGWKYLCENGKEKVVFMHLLISYDDLPMNEIMQYCRDKKWLSRLYELGAYKVLLEYGVISDFIENHSLNTNFLLKFPSKVKWEDLWDYYHKDDTYRNHLIWAAERNQNVPECAAFLKEHTGLRGFINRIF